MTLRGNSTFLRLFANDDRYSIAQRQCLDRLKDLLIAIHHHQEAQEDEKRLFEPILSRARKLRAFYRDNLTPFGHFIVLLTLMLISCAISVVNSIMGSSKEYAVWRYIAAGVIGITTTFSFIPLLKKSPTTKLYVTYS